MQIRLRPKFGLGTKSDLFYQVTQCVDIATFMMHICEFWFSVPFFVSANQETHKAEISRLKQIIAGLECAGSKPASTVR